MTLTGVVWIDFSTSDAHDDGPTDQSWQEKLQVEMNKLEDMLGRYRQVRTKFFLFFFFWSYDPVDKKSASGRCASLEGNAAKIWRPRKCSKDTTATIDSAPDGFHDTSLE